jgi:dTDP-4-dehydrorhamnose reductase
MLRVVDAQLVSPNWCPLVTEAVAVAIATMSVKCVPWGTYHISGTGSTTWHEFARLVYEHADKVWGVYRPHPTPVHTEEYGAAAKRPPCSVLNPTKYEKTFGHQLPDWKTQFLHCINSMKWDQ